MAFPQIETGYKPEFGLGAVYQGFNAANADQMSQLEILKQFLANQRDQNEQPVDLAQKQQNLAAKAYQTDRRYQEGMLNQAEGTGLRQMADGQIARDTRETKTAATNATNTFESFRDRAAGVHQKELLRQLEILANGGSAVNSEPTQRTPLPIMGGGQDKVITPVQGDMTPVGVDKKGRVNYKGGASWQYGATTRANLESRLAIMQAELAQNPNDQALQRDIENTLSQLNDAPADVLSNFQQPWSLDGDKLPSQKPIESTPVGSNSVGGTQVSPQATEPSQGPTNLLQRMSKLMTMEPKHMGKLEEIQAQGDSRIQAAQIAADARIAAADQAAKNGDTVKAAELRMAIAAANEALKYEQLINGQDIQAQKSALLAKIASGDKSAQPALNTLNENVKRWKGFADHYRAQEQAINKKHGLAVTPPPELAQAPTAQQKIIKIPD